MSINHYYNEVMSGCGHVLEAYCVYDYWGKVGTVARCLVDNCPNSMGWQDWNWIVAEDGRSLMSLYIVKSKLVVDTKSD